MILWKSCRILNIVKGWVGRNRGFGKSTARSEGGRTWGKADLARGGRESGVGWGGRLGLKSLQLGQMRENLGESRPRKGGAVRVGLGVGVAVGGVGGLKSLQLGQKGVNLGES